jgi:hypothetical protein
MIKKISAIILALVLCLSVMVVPASAAVELGDAQISFSLEWDKESYSAGETAILSVYMDADDALSLATGSFLIGLNSAVFSPDVNTQDALREGSTTAEWFNAWYIDASLQTSILASTVVPKVQAANTAEENELYDWYVKYTAGKNTGGWHENTGTTKAGFNGYDFNPDEPIITYTLIVNEDVADGTAVNAAITSGSVKSTPTQTAWKYYKNPGNATTTANVAKTSIDVSQTVVTATVGEAEAPHVHAYDEGVVTTEPTHTEKGVKTFTCACGATYTEEIPANVDDHTYDEGVVTTAPTHTEKGVKTFTCECGDTYTEEIPANADDHTYDEGVVTKAPTHTEKGVKTFTCECGDTYTEEIPANVDDHTYDEGVVTTAPTHTEKGVKTFTCECGDTYTEDIPANVDAHTYDEEITKVPNCTEPGEKTFTCECGDTYTEEIRATGHVDLTTETVEATFTATGYEKVTCACGEVVSEKVLPIKTLVNSWKNQVRFQKNADGSYAGKFDIRTIAVINGADFMAAFGSEEDAVKMIDEIGFVYAKASKVSADEFSMDAVKDIVENGASYAGYANAPVAAISSSLSAGNYAFTCLVKNIPDSAKTDSLIAVGYVTWDSDNDGEVDSYAYYNAEQVISFEAAFAAQFDKNFPNG